MLGHDLGGPQNHDSVYERERVTHDIGNELDTLFDRHAKYTSIDEDGTQRVTLRVQLSASAVPGHVTSKVDENGVRTAYMWLQPGKALGSEMYKYTDGGNEEPSLEPYAVDADTGEFIPRPAGQYHDPNTDSEIAYWGKVWVRNLHECPPFQPKSKRLSRFMGRIATR